MQTILMSAGYSRRVHAGFSSLSLKVIKGCVLLPIQERATVRVLSLYY